MKEKDTHISQKKKKVINFNHISEKLAEDQVDELKNYYRVYHKKCWAHKQAKKKFMRLKLVGNSLSLLFASGGLVAAVASGGIALVGVSTVSVLIQGYMKHKNLDLKIYQSTYAFQSYQHLLNDIEEQLRSGNADISSLYTKMQSLDNFMADNTPIIDKLFQKYDEKFTTEE